MAFCTSCGKKLDSDSVFCDNCGAKQELIPTMEAPDSGITQEPSGTKPIGDENNQMPTGEPPMQAPPERTIPPAGSEAPQSYIPPQPGGGIPNYAAPPVERKPALFVIALKNLLPMVKSYCKSPAGITSSALKMNDLMMAVVLLVIQILACGLVLFGILFKCCWKIQSLIVSTYGYFSYGDTSTVPAIRAPFFPSLFFGLLMSIVFIGVYVLVMFAVLKILKSTATLKETFITCGINSVFVTCLLLAGFLLSFLSISLGLLLLLASFITWIVMGLVVLQSLTPVTPSSKSWICYILAVFATCLVAGFIGSKLFGLALGELTVSYQGTKAALRTLIGSMPTLDTLIQALLGGTY